MPDRHPATMNNTTGLNEHGAAILDSVLLLAEHCGIAHNGGAGGQYLLAATPQQLVYWAREFLRTAAEAIRVGPGPLTDEQRPEPSEMLTDIDAALAALVDVKPLADYGLPGTYDTVQARRKRGLDRLEQSLMNMRRSLTVDRDVQQPLRTKLDVTLTKGEVESFCGYFDDDTEDGDDVVRLLVGDGHTGFGLYVACPDYPEEGATLVKALPAPLDRDVQIPGAHHG